MLNKILNKISTKLFAKTNIEQFPFQKIIIPKNGCHLNMPKDMMWAFEGGDYYEKNVIYFLDKIINLYEQPIFIDIGANYGYYSIKYSADCSKIFAFEPVQNTFKVLSENIEINKIKNITTFMNGLSNVKEQRKINLYNASGNNSIYERDIPEGHPLKKTGVETIQLLVLDDLINNNQVEKPNIIKIDVEGAELNVLLGAKQVISKYRPTVLLEYSEDTSRDAGYSKDSLLKSLELVNYKIYGIPEDPNDFRLINEKDFGNEDVSNLIFLPEELLLIN